MITSGSVQPKCIASSRPSVFFPSMRYGSRSVLRSIDPVAAARTPFGGTIAHGFLTLSLLSAMTYDAVPPLEGVVMGVNYGFDKLRFLAPVPAGSNVRGRFKLLSA